MQYTKEKYKMCGTCKYAAITDRLELFCTKAIRENVEVDEAPCEKWEMDELAWKDIKAGLWSL